MTEATNAPYRLRHHNIWATSVLRLRELGLANTRLRRLQVPQEADHVFPALRAVVLDTNNIDEVSDHRTSHVTADGPVT